jgi:hypothetical protein
MRDAQLDARDVAWSDVDSLLASAGVVARAEENLRRAADDRSAAAAGRAAAAVDRVKAAVDRDRAAHDRARARVDRDALLRQLAALRRKR